MNSTDYDFRTALHLAASNGSLEVASFLLQQPGAYHQLLRGFTSDLSKHHDNFHMSCDVYNSCLMCSQSLRKKSAGIEVNPVDRKKCTPMEDAVRHSQDVVYSLLKKCGGVRSNHPSVLEYLEQNSAKRKAQRDTSLKNRTMRVVESTFEFGLIKRLEASERTRAMQI